jgi:hypothetical protein
VIKYLLGYRVGEKVEIPAAEELLASYNDWYAFNSAQYQKFTDHVIGEDGIYEEKTDADEIKQKEKLASDDVAEFKKLWGSLDFAAATLSGMTVDWEKIQEILLREQENKIRPQYSSLNNTARQLRAAASVLTFAERVLTALKGKHTDEEMQDAVKQGFEVLLNAAGNPDIEIPEFSAEKQKFLKIKTADGIIDYAKRLFELAK